MQHTHTSMHTCIHAHTLYTFSTSQTHLINRNIFQQTNKLVHVDITETVSIAEHFPLRAGTYNYKQNKKQKHCPEEKTECKKDFILEELPHSKQTAQETSKRKKTQCRKSNFMQMGEMGATSRRVFACKSNTST